ncbi:hypothetical protein ACFSKU_03145 [Pontibacter silvestris]|uniref:Uncharacterized protein n=1 Tax=Pontibacter silvestris TaxID=2305183 RepID=A0ABW4WTV7_9BACT|nr:hypothetical protein [Pontibacter silvestris]MCC9138106.1 hypothetical protein [Pontibacter silvestris]
MKTKEPLNETRYSGTNQPKELYAINKPETDTSYDATQPSKLNESHHNLMQSWLNLRGMDRDLAAMQK